MGDGRPQRAGIGGGGVRLDVGAGEGVRIAGAVDGGDVHALGLEGLGDAGGAGEEIERGAGAGGLADPREDGDEAALGAEVFDHRGRHGGPPYDGRSWRPGTIQKPLEMRGGRRVRTGCAGTRPTRIRRSNLSRRLRGGAVHGARGARRAATGPGCLGPDTDPEPIRIVSLCAGQGRDVIDVVATHPRGPEVSALLVELDPALVAFARDRAAAAGAGGRAGSGSSRATPRSAAGTPTHVPADIVLVCGVFGNISAADITRTIQAMRGFCVPGGQVVWTRHRRPPDLHARRPGRLRRRRVHGAGLRGPRRHRHGDRPPPLDGATGALRPRPAALRLRRRRVEPGMSR